jgi:hypothetical protein
VDPDTYLRARARIEEVRTRAARVRTDDITLTIDGPYLPSTLRARGAVAIEPPKALRMILVGPGGGTAMDLWASERQFAFRIPALDRIILDRGGSGLEERRGLPVDFLRWWLLDPFGGELLAARRHPTAFEVLLRKDGFTTVALVRDDGGVDAQRRWIRLDDGESSVIEEEWVQADRVECGRVHYRQRSTRLEVTVRCEGSRPEVRAQALESPFIDGVLEP